MVRKTYLPSETSTFSSDFSSDGIFEDDSKVIFSTSTGACSLAFETSSSEIALVSGILVKIVGGTVGVGVGTGAGTGARESAFLGGEVSFIDDEVQLPMILNFFLLFI